MKKILVVDDDPMLTRLVKINLELSGFLVEEAWDGDSALKSLEKKGPDLMVLDLMMPGTDGWEVLRRVRENRELAGLPVVLLTARAQRQDLMRGWEMGADDYVVKPFNPKVLSDQVKGLLETTPEQRQARRRSELARLDGLDAEPKRS